MSLSSNLMNRFRCGELFLSISFGSLGETFLCSSITRLLPLGAGAAVGGAAADAEKWVSGVVHSPVIAEPALRTVGTNPAL